MKPRGIMRALAVGALAIWMAPPSSADIFTDHERYLKEEICKNEYGRVRQLIKSPYINMEGYIDTAGRRVGYVEAAINCVSEVRIVSMLAEESEGSILSCIVFTILVNNTFSTYNTRFYTMAQFKNISNMLIGKVYSGKLVFDRDCREFPRDAAIRRKAALIAAFRMAYHDEALLEFYKTIGADWSERVSNSGLELPMALWVFSAQGHKNEAGQLRAVQGVMSRADDPQDLILFRDKSGRSITDYAVCVGPRKGPFASSAIGLSIECKLVMPEMPAVEAYLQSLGAPTRRSCDEWWGGYCRIRASE